MSAVWMAIALAAVITAVMKAAGPVALGGRELGPAATKLVVLLPPALLTALVVTQTAADGSRLVLDARAGGMAVAVVAIALRVNMLLVLLCAVATTAGLRALGVAE